MNLYTIGHSKHTLVGFAALCKPFYINMVIDVRSIPYSRHAPQFNHTSIGQSLSQFGLAYEYRGNVLGGKLTAPDFLDESGCVDFTKVEQSDCFQKGLDAVIAKMNSGYTIALMCAEKDPLYCHRFLLVSRALKARGIVPRHLLSDGSVIGDDELLDGMAHSQNHSSMQMTLLPSDYEACRDRAYQSLSMKKVKMNLKKNG